MIQLLELMKPGLIETTPEPPGPEISPASPRPPTLTAEAQELLLKVEAGGVPAYVTDSLRRIAQENGVIVESDTTPNSIIDDLQQRVLDFD